MASNVHPQNVLDYHGTNTIFSVWNFKQLPAQQLKDAFEKVCALVINLNHSAAIRFPDNGASCVMGIGPMAWQIVGLPHPAPRELNDFKEIAGAKYTAVATRGDLHFHLRALNSSICYDMALEISKILSAVADPVEEVHGFRYWDGRSILGFVDGTENPQGDQRAYFGLIGDQEPAYKGGSYLFVQKYIHDLQAFKALPLEEQEKVFGRYRDSDVEMSDELKPSNSHSALANVGDDLKIIRDNMPFGNMSTNEMGTYFIAYASTFDTVNKMLINMFVGDPPGNYDRLLDFSTAKTGSLFYVPTLEMLDSMSSGDFTLSGAAPLGDTNVDASEVLNNKKTELVVELQSLGIGSLKS
ncbi:putative iron-dependent peroxidase [Arachidicoccus rhizosphaerae]|uniref:Putative iron-dependent peroxidase n=1 Tax=Arachidicoccus rhizosphaerae TaxID=551991 RepID=A0A1H3ZHF5_9BACT|nr:Dyp-type peroxidase [Arachidicoccus rhizosphaerae]SEA22772.1 putative iron-dependent peroxidase [Arachidicoccus rhizosphaerae]